jgi:xylulokinase
VRRSGGELGAAFGAARLGRLAVTGEAPEAVCTAPPIVGVVEPEVALGELMGRRRPIFTALYPRLRASFLEFGA